MLPILFSAFILSACCTAKGNCISYDELRELKTEFAINLYRQVSEAENRTNLVVSPASVAVSLELLQFGAQGNTFTELQDVLGYSIHGNVLLKILIVLLVVIKLQLYEGDRNCTHHTKLLLSLSLQDVVFSVFDSQVSDGQRKTQGSS